MGYGLLGEKLGHSFSKDIHKLIGGYEYELYEKNIEEIPSFLESGIDGFNVTIPYKIEIMKYLDEVGDNAKKIGCVNTVVNRNGKWIGENTDYFGFEYTLESLGEDISSAIILGDGATSKTVATVLSDKQIKFHKLSRKTHPYYLQIDEFLDVDLVVNTTPVGMYPNNGESLISLKKFKNLKAVVDVVYNPIITPILFEARELNIPNSNGLLMLVAQAVKAAEIFTGMSEVEKIDSIRTEIMKNRNLILIGMPDSGKSSVGPKIAERLGREFVDLDSEIEEFAQKSIPEIFSEDGEDVFRSIETKICKKFGKLNGLVISTGGGVVTKRENYRPLKQNGKIYLLKRELKDLNLSNRPLSKEYGTAEELWNKRREQYLEFADKIVVNTDIEKSVEEIVGDFYGNIGN
ncbi:shikimate dehydrogenase [Peptoniphilus asaccharolyticus DSM 20463]|uniref:Shikimate kinase n=1 Tax=Peptoniphilus asaccharolyticus DSM 20463 TaxID=573058 RepID=A0A1W1VI25_PEPAS|nr:shikimate kinase [Peptoniphilus asaccharolyticus]MBL7574332.1 shikimate dehydrogenase [Peptoniphilus asaccharolyticus]SMB93017.1 shikimate dehydrogenase [Peptoniphilus asaccharolyticus DSM 20463]